MDLALFEISPVGHLVPIRGVDGRTGRSYDHMAFVPEPLSDEVELSQAANRAVARATLALGRLDAASGRLPNPGLLRRPTLRKEAQSTSALEGTFAPLEQVLADDEDDGDAEPSRLGAALQEVWNYVRAANSAFAWVEGGYSITGGMLMHSQGVLVNGTPADTADRGQIRTIQVAIGAEDSPIEEARFVPMPPGIELEAALQDLVRWISENDDGRDPLVSAAMVHYQFETLHPFRDGNGRIGRLLIVLQLLVYGILRQPLLSASPWFEARRTEYQEHLYNVSARGDWDSWVRFFSAGLEASADDTRRRLEALLDLQRDFEQRVRDSAPRAALARDIASELIGYPTFTVPSVTRRLAGRATPQAVSDAVRKLVDLGIAIRHEGAYRHRYVTPEVLRVLAEPQQQGR